ncbi:MAG: plasmid stability protein StbA, partial [Candidatus Competibacteraceae bacterium]|nr:plasmid stability protein StbA [Candidatus Competibacteraceae bacterium]
MTELTDQKFAHTDVPSPSIDAMNVGQAGLDDGYAYTKVALPDGRLVAVPSRARMGSAGVTWIHEDEQKIFEYETGGTVYSVGAVDGEPTQFDEYPGSALNRVIV